MGREIHNLRTLAKAFIAAIFGVVYADTGLRKFREVILLVARKNGKSLIASAIALYCLVADGEAEADCYSVATKREQAKIVWTEAVKMVNKSPALKKRLKCLIGEIQYPKTESKFQPLASDSGTLDGLNVHLAVIDELHEIKDKNLIDVIDNETSSREQPLVLITTTCGQVRENVFDQKYNAAAKVIDGYFCDDGIKDENLLPLFYELDNRSEWQDEAFWIKASPNLCVSKSIDYLRREVLKSQNDSINLKNTLCKDFNIRETATQAWLTFEEAVCEQDYDISNIGVKYAFACILRDNMGFATEIYPMPAVGAEALYAEDNTLWLKFTLKNGKVVVFPYSDIIHLRQDFNNNDVFGDSPVETLRPLMEIVTTTDQGIVKAIKNSGVIKWLLKVKQMMTDDDLTNYVAKFNKNFLSVESAGEGGAAAVDSKADIQQVDPKDYVPNSSQMENTTQRIYNFFGVNQKI